MGGVSGDLFTPLRDQPSGSVSGGAIHNVGHGGIEIHPSPLLATHAIICIAFKNFKKLNESFQTDFVIKNFSFPLTKHAAHECADLSCEDEELGLTETTVAPEHPRGPLDQRRGINASEEIAPAMPTHAFTSSSTEPEALSSALENSAPRRRQRSLSHARKLGRDQSCATIAEVSSPSRPTTSVESGGPSEPPGIHSLLGDLAPHVAEVCAKPKRKRHRRKHDHPVSDRDSTVANVITYASLLSQGRLRLSHSPDELQSFIEAHVERTRNKYSPDAIEQAAEADAAGFEWPAAAMYQDADEVRAGGSVRGVIEAKIPALCAVQYGTGRRVV